ncbi:MAG: phosphoribosylformylglycinamidine synthase subunit PurQ [Kofleriaceae bacterium]
MTAASAGSAASALAQAHGQLGDATLDVDPILLASAWAAMQELLGAGLCRAYHDVSDGGALVAALELGWASGLGVELGPVHAADALPTLFAEEPGALLAVAPADLAAVKAVLERHHLTAATWHLGSVRADRRVRVLDGDDAALLDTTLTALRARWSSVTHAIARRRDDPACADEEHAARVDDAAPGLTAHVPFDPADDVAAPMIARGARPRVAILREQGVNGQVEMAVAFTRAGFDAVDVHMSDLIDGRHTLTDVHGVVACGGFSFGDVLGAGRGWAMSILHNPRARAALEALWARPATFTLGVCNGCQMLSHLRALIPGAEAWPSLRRNRSEQFEARLSLVEILPSPSLFFAGMAGARLPIAVAHGEGRAELADGAQPLVAARYVDGAGRVATTYPANPNGSPGGVTAFTTADGRATIMMPHPERVIRTPTLSWHPAEWGDDSPWLRMFRNARAWLG